MDLQQPQPGAKTYQLSRGKMVGSEKSAGESEEESITCVGWPSWKAERERDVRQCNSVYHMNCNKEQPRGETFPGQHASYDYGEGDFWLSLIWQLQKCPQTGVNQQSNRHCSVRNIAYIKCSYHLRQCQENGQGRNERKVSKERKMQRTAAIIYGCV